jgi:hypothetical protein
VAAVPAPVPTRRQARILLLSLAGFWLLAAASNVDEGPGSPPGGRLGSPISLILFALTIGAGFAFFYTLFAVWQPVTDEPPLVMMFWADRDSARDGWRALSSLVRPSWVSPALHATGWGVRACLLALSTTLLCLAASSLSPWGY